MLDHASIKMIKITIKFIKAERRKIDIERRQARQDLHNYTDRRLRLELGDRLNDICGRLKGNLDRVKERKLVNLVNMGGRTVEQNH